MRYNMHLLIPPPDTASVSIGLPSLGHIADAAARSARRYPLVLAAGIIAAVAGILLLHSDGSDIGALRLLAVASLGLPLSFALATAAERRARTTVGYWAVAGAGIPVLAAVWLAWSGWTESQQWMRYVQLSAAAHLLVAFAPFAGRDEPRAFWQYNRILFLRFLLAALYAAVLWLGISGALLALDELLGVPVEGHAYGRLWMVMTFVFNPWFFVAGVPEDVGALEEETHYPRGLRVFTQYVLVPLVVVYLVILTLYLAKVAVTREWPSGWIGYLVSGVAAIGMLSWLLVHPLEETEEHAWVKGFTRGFHIALLPAVVMLWLALWQRVAQYGLTERRYFLLVLSVWLFGIAVYYIVSRSRSIKVIPASLCAVAILTLAGPWGAYSVSRWSQAGRLEAVFARNDMLADGVLRPAPRTVSDSDAVAIRSGLLYLLEGHGRRAVDAWLTDSLRTRVGIVRNARVGNPEATTRVIMNALNVSYDNARNARDAARRPGEAGRFNFAADRRQSSATNIAGYTVAVDFMLTARRDSVIVAPGVAIRMSPDSTSLLVTRAGTPVLDVPLLALLDSLAGRSQGAWQVPDRLMRIEHRSGNAAALVRLTSISGLERIPRRVRTVAGTMFLKLP